MDDESTGSSRKVVNLDHPLRERVRTAAFHERVTESELVRRALRDYLDKLEASWG